MEISLRPLAGLNFDAPEVGKVEEADRVAESDKKCVSYAISQGAKSIANRIERVTWTF